MSIVTFDGDTLATGRASWKNNYIWTPTTKIFHINPPCKECLKRFRLHESHDHLVWGACGNSEDVPLILTWMEEGGALPELKEKEVSCGLLLTVQTGHIHGLTGRMTLAQYAQTVPIADGGGHEIALGAMLAGATAVRAIELVMLRSSWEAGGVDWYNWRTGETNLQESVT